MGYNMTQFMHKCELRPDVAFSIVVLHRVFPFEITMLEDSSIHILHVLCEHDPKYMLRIIGGKCSTLLSVELWIAKNFIRITTNTSVLAQGLVTNLIAAGHGREAAFAAAVLGDNALMEKAWQDTGMLAEAVLHAQVRSLLN